MQEPRTSERRSRKNRAAAIRKYRAYAEAAGYSPIEIVQQIQDICDMYHLQQNSEEA